VYRARYRYRIKNVAEIKVMMNNPSKVGKSREIVNEYWSNWTMDLFISYSSLYLYLVDIPREGERTPSDQILELIKDIKDSIKSSNREPD
jgi:hypothetical protein